MLKIFAVLFYITVSLSKCKPNNISAPVDDGCHFVHFEKYQQIIQTVSDKFLSFSLDMGQLRDDMKNLPIGDEKFIKLTQHLKPAYMRIGGTAADLLYFEEKITSKINVNRLGIDNEINNKDYDFTYDGQDMRNLTLTGRNFSSLYNFSQMTGTRMLFDLNVLFRNADGTWNEDNPEEIILFAEAREMKLDWQLGNEPNSFKLVFNITVPAKQLSEDYCKLRRILNEFGYEKSSSILVGPEVNHIDDEKHKGIEYVEEFLQNINDCVDYITWHQYYLDGHAAKVEDFVNPLVFNLLPMAIKRLQETIERSGKNISTWISETSTATGGGAPELSDRYVATFLWLDKLGTCAKAGVQVVIRQTLLGGNYAMVGHDLEPNPDWWVSILFKKLVSGKVLNLITPDNNMGKIRLYAHCAVPELSSFDTPQIIIYGMNLNSENAKIRLDGLPVEERTKASALFLTSDSLQSRNIILNGKVLELKPNGDLPDLSPQSINISRPVELPAFSIIFLLLSDVESSPC